MIDELELALMTSEQAAAHAAACYEAWNKVRETSHLGSSLRSDAYIDLVQARHYCTHPISYKPKNASCDRCTKCRKYLDVVEQELA